MDLAGILSKERSALVKRWRDALLDTYPPDARQFFKKEKDKFANPVGSIVGQELEALFDAFVAGNERERVVSCLENILRVRAVQDFQPSRAVGFILSLKEIVRERIQTKELGNGIGEGLKAFDADVDALLLLAFDIYSRCRQRLFELRVNEVRNQVGRLLQRANLVCEIPDAEPDA
jgi:hypothetical protein